jgi:hypothetical protein
MDNSPNALRRSIAALEAEFHKLLRDAPWKQNTAGVSPQDAADEKGDGAPRKGAFLAMPDIPPTPTDTPQPKQPWYKTFDGWKPKLESAKVILEVAAIPFAIAYAVITFYQWQDLQKNFEADQRSWLRVLSDINPQTIKGNAVGLHFKNFGKVVAESIVIDAVVEVVNSDSAPRLKVEPPLTRAYSGFLFPGDEPAAASPVPIHPSPQGNLPITAPEIDNLTKGKTYLAIYGVATYRDHFRKHWTRFCYWSLQTDPLVTFYANAKACTEWNSFGDGPPPK